MISESKSSIPWAAARWIFWLVILCAVVASAACNRTAAVPPAQAPSESGWVYQDKAHHADVAVVFVHGLFGDTRGTWTNDNGKTFFDLIHAHPKIHQPVDVFAFGFPSTMLEAGSFDIQDASKALYDKLLYHELAAYPSVVFVAHSMGGLVVMRTLMSYPDIRNRTPLVVLYGTPQEGAQIATIARKVSNNTALEQMLPTDKDGYLRGLDTDWKLQDAKTRPKVVCAFEKKPTYGVMVVPWSSATRFCDGPASPIGESHLGMVKPDGPDHDAVIVLVNALNDTVTGPHFAAELTTPDFAPQGNDYVFPIASPIGKHPARLINMGRRSATFTLAEVSAGLYVWPNDTPRILAGGERIDLFFGLEWGATASEYRFVLRSDAGAEKRVLVKVADLAAMQKEQATLQRQASANVYAMLQGPKDRIGWGSVSDKEKANLDIADTVRETIRRSNPDLPKEAQWVLAAEVMNSMHLPELSLLALAKVRQDAPRGATLPAFAKLSASANAQLAQQGKGGPASPAVPRGVPGGAEQRLAATPDQSLISMKTANLLKSFPGLSSLQLGAYGLVTTPPPEKNKQGQRAVVVEGLGNKRQ